ncbi:hypothetical protein DC366_08420 [Pelagivirga sediminicola]|uniref:Uncharacterized protein n=1 Tax=Pelagivirga sediminicola TaxID=2170575 RepID=A0A2T7G771_9RHOB|nr:hypothetical protein [Pelagivirga sediminicola]PVA10262.1 hypothetical protein DC366_08420 [Pelagivirga sediminicola]
MTPAEIEAHFTRSDGTYLCARWGRPIVPVVFGVNDETLPVIKGAIEAVALLAAHSTAETDPELGANLMMFFMRDWDELLALPDLSRMIPELEPLVARLKAVDANQYRLFRFEPDGAIRAAFVFLRMDAHLDAVPADALALGQAVQTILLWSETAFRERSALAAGPDGEVILRPEIGALIRAAYDPVLPGAAQDASHALRLSARMQQG